MPVRVLLVNDHAVVRQGFVVSDKTLGHLGLKSMKERAERVGGIFKIESQPGQGTRVLVWAPLRLL
jgi:signal transduction histidine kinase